MAIYKNQILGNYSVLVINYNNSLDERNVPSFVTYLDENLISILMYLDNFLCICIYLILSNSIIYIFYTFCIRNP